MRIWHYLSLVLGFRTIPTTVLLVLLYAGVFSTVLVTDELPNVPEDKGGLDFDGAWSDLHEIAARPHPYNSHSNDLVHAYVLARLQSLASHYPHISVIEDLVSNASFAVDRGGDKKYGVYFEGTNILVKIDGTDSDSGAGGVLFSAHYDSVSTAPGATDDGMGIASLIALVEHFGESRPKKTAVFNFNNGEEDGLLGAYAFLIHPWSKLTHTFLNLEGAASGGRPMLFRGTSLGPLTSFRTPHVPHPHASSVAADVFALGVIPSSTDYGIYSNLGAMEGLDFAFYKGRSAYHTREDSVPGTAGGVGGVERALWAMMEGARGAGGQLLNENQKGRGERAVWFELFAAFLVVFPLNTLFIINIVLLAAGPILLLVLVYAQHVVSRRRIPSHPRLFARTRWESFKNGGWVGSVWRVVKFWLMLVLGVGAQIFLGFGYLQLNPFIVYSHPTLVLISTLSLAYLSTTLVLALPVSARHAFPEQQRHTTILQLYLLTWVLQLLGTIALAKLHIGGVYLVTVWHACVLLGSVLGCLEGLAGAKGFDRESLAVEEDLVDEDGMPILPGGPPDEDNEEADANEHTPLIQGRKNGKSKTDEEEQDEEHGAIGWWILQMLVVVPAPVILVSHVGVFAMAALSQTLADGSDPVFVYAVASLLAIAAVLPLAPFTFKLSRYLTFLILIVFLASTAYNWLTFPFSKDAQLKVFFQQRVELDLTRGTPLPGHARTTLMGAPAFLDSAIIAQLPSAWGAEHECVPHVHGAECSWASDLIPSPELNNASTPKRAETFITVDVTRTGANSARLEVAGTNTRACRVFLDSTPITNWTVHGASGSYFPGRAVPEAGVPSIRLWSRTWGRKFVVDIEWPASSSDLKEKERKEVQGRVACEWVEYESATAGSGRGERGGQIPAYEEVLAFLPQWAVVTKEGDGLVEAWGNFTV